MKDRILYLTEFPADVGIARSIQEKYDCDIYAIVDTNKYLKRFFQEQRLVKYEKIWYYRDYIQKIDGKPDLEYLTSFEKRYNISLWSIAYSDRIFYKYNPYYNFNSDEILCILEQECKLFEKILDETKPDFVIIKSPDFNQSQLLYDLCRASGIKILTLSSSRFGNRCIISERTDMIDKFDEESVSNWERRNLQELQEYIRSYTKQTISANKEIAGSSLEKLKGIWRYFLIVCNDEYRKYYKNFGRTRTKILINEISLFLKRFYREHFMKKRFLKEIEKDTKFVYFPLQFEPERTILMDAPFYANQIEVIANIAKSLPVEYKLYVKEHPIQVFYGWRPVSYYESIMNMPNVKLLHHSVSNEKILNNCSLVTTITGTLGLEAAFHHVPTIIFANVIYDSLPSVYHVKSFEDLPKAIQISLTKKVTLEDLNKYVSYVIKNSFEHDFSEIYMHFNHFFYGGFLYDCEVSTDEGVSILNEDKILLDRLATEYIKKIKHFKNLKSNTPSQ